MSFFQQREHSCSHTKPVCIQGFSFITKKFHKLRELVFAYDEEYYITSLSSFGGNRLSLLLQQDVTEYIHLWGSSSLAEYIVSWTRLFTGSDSSIPTLQSSTTPPIHVTFSTKTTFLLSILLIL